MTPAEKQLVSDLIEYYEAGECYCAALRHTSMNPRSQCLGCKICEKIGNTGEAVFNDLRKTITNEN